MALLMILPVIFSKDFLMFATVANVALLVVSNLSISTMLLMLKKTMKSFYAILVSVLISHSKIKSIWIKF